jgi:hypothetical protein
VTLVADIIKGSVVLPDRREIPEWAAAEVDFGNAEAFKGPFDINNVPWIREMMRAFKDPTVRIVTMIAPPQESGKTKGAEVCLAWRITTAPAKMAFNTSTNVSAQKWQETRWEQMHQAVPAMVKKLSPNPNHKKKGRIIFADKTFLLIQGAETPANRQSDTVEVQINDELHLWERPWVTQMHSRTKAYKDTKKILNISLGGDEGSELHELWTEGCQGEWSHHCPKCSQPFQYVFNNQRPDCNIRFDLTKVIQHADGRLDLTEFDKTVHVVCPRPGCAHRMDYDEEMLVKLNQGGRYVLMNPGANAEKVSLHVNSFAIGRRRWSEILLPWVRMNLRGGIFAPDILRTFICEELAEFWKEKPMVVSSEIRLGSYTRAEILKPGMWQDEWIRVFLGDNQRGSKGDVPHRWYLCRAFARDGRSRLVDCGRINEWSKFRDKQIELGVPEWSTARPGPWTCVDRRYNPVEVDEICARYKWFGLMGDDSEAYLHSKDSPHAGKLMPFSEARYIDIGFGTQDQGRRHAIYHLWSSQKVQDMLAILRDGKANSYEVPSDIMTWCPEYADHINSHRQVMEQTRVGQEKRVWKRIGGWPDHLYDCECEAIVLGLMAGVFKPE